MSAVYVIANGVVLVDTKNPNNGQKILDKVKTVTDKPITHIINTHTHGDHVGSNAFFPAAVEIVTQENTAANMAKMKNFAEPATKHGLPDRTFKDRMTLLSGNESIDLYYFGTAHTGGDAFVVFRNLRVMHAGDVFSGTEHADHGRATTAAAASRIRRRWRKPPRASRASTPSFPATAPSPTGRASSTTASSCARG